MALCGTVLAGVLAGCELAASQERKTAGWEPTASYDQIMSAPSEPSPIQTRHWAPTQARYEKPTVSHFPSYFLDPFETRGDGVDGYGWSYMDLAAVAYSPARFVVNTVAIPVSMVKDPPWKLICTNLDQPIPECPTPACATQPAPAARASQ